MEECRVGEKQTGGVIEIHLSEGMLGSINFINNKVGVFVVSFHNGVGTTVELTLLVGGE